MIHLALSSIVTELFTPIPAATMLPPWRVIPALSKAGLVADLRDRSRLPASRDDGQDVRVSWSTRMCGNDRTYVPVGKNKKAGKVPAFLDWINPAY